jgi:hypothetical protein
VADGNPLAAGSNAYINFFAQGDSEYFNEVRFASGQNAFESDNHAVQAVPEPLTIIGSGIALGFGGFLKRKQKASEKK